MKSLKALFVAAAVAATVALTGCSSLEQLNARGQALRAADPVAYDNMTGESNYAAQNPQYNVHGS
ncbi:MAG: hypothetical protein WC749_01070 [Dehalococcoidia bacterium]|uniref:hypothetical protein n=1 Tax=unclassified Pseudomonas TaxID=196821 RepID=UPI00147529E8|nr:MULTISPECIES: hypothetical protein [unclassified Pseudomonas]NMX92474.1 hypothetical protein [Pseudomonas sp. WS 5086]NMY47248.1 hypothetical protein [Pseudomonas sp. WS 5027]